MIGYPNLELLNRLYNIDKKSVSQIAAELGFSEHKVNYWLGKHKILKMTISEAVYIRHNPKGDPFKFSLPKSQKESELFGLGLGLYWGEGNKANKNVVKYIDS